VDFLRLVKKRDRNLGLGLLVFFLLIGLGLLFLKISPSKSFPKALDYLPPETNFYYQWVGQEALQPEYLGVPVFFVYQVPNIHLEKVRSLLTSSWPAVGELIWFQTDQAEGYIIQFKDRLPKDFFNNLKKNHPEYFLAHPQSAILLVSASSELMAKLSSPAPRSEAGQLAPAGINIYYQTEQLPQFLLGLHSNLVSLLTKPEVWLNFFLNKNKHGEINIFQKGNAQGLVVQNYWSALRVPKDFTLALGLTASSSSASAEIIKTRLVKPFFTSLASYNLDSRELTKYLDGQAAIFQVGDSWLLVAQKDFKPQLGDLADNLQLKELKKVLPDGTAYVELVTSDEQLIKELDFRGQKFWQIADLFGLNLGGYYYLSNSRPIIEGLILAPGSINSLASLCPSKRQQLINDFIYLQSASLPQGDLKQFLDNYHFQDLELSSFTNHDWQGLKLCF
jgi:hypothetical protein